MSNTGSNANTSAPRVIPQHISMMQKSLDEAHLIAARVEELCMRVTGNHPAQPPTAAPKQGVDRPMNMPEQLGSIHNSLLAVGERITRALNQIESVV